MCGYCGCDQTKIVVKDEHNHFHTHENSTHSHHDHQIIQIEKDILAENQRYAEKNRQYFNTKKIRAFNFVSSPGSGKTTLLVETIRALQTQIAINVIEGDQQTRRDADRIAATGAPVLQINTGKACHLDAHQIGHALEHLPLQPASFLFIENVGNLVCPALFDLGEFRKVVILSVTEGEDKPLKYPYMFDQSDLMIINKIDLLPYVNFDVNECINYAKRINPKIEVLQTSATTKDGIAQWNNWIIQHATF